MVIDKVTVKKWGSGLIIFAMSDNLANFSIQYAGYLTSAQLNCRLKRLKYDSGPIRSGISSRFVYIWAISNYYGRQ